MKLVGKKKWGMEKKSEEKRRVEKEEESYRARASFVIELPHDQMQEKVDIDS